MKVSAILFSLLVACQVLPAAAQTAGMTHAEMADVTRADLAGQFGPERLRAEYHFAVARPKFLSGKPLAYTYDFVTDTTMSLAGGNAIKTQGKVSYAYDKDGRSRIVSTMAGLERIIIADPTQQAVYLVCPERKEILRMTGAALGSPVVPQAPVKPPAKPNLGEKTIAGVKAFGNRSDVTIPAGAQGNDKPLVHTSETWYSPDLAALVYMHMTTPEFGRAEQWCNNMADALRRVGPPKPPPTDPKS